MDLTEKTENLNRHPWEISRCNNILSLLGKNGRHKVYADIGSGDKYFASKLLQNTGGTVFAIDSGYSKEKSENDGLICLNDITLLKNNSIDCLIMMDVLEHIEDENSFLKEALDKLRPNGKIIITVPAMQFLYSSHDVFLKHYRRYNRKNLHNLLKRNDLIIDHSHYFYSSLFVLRSFSLILELLCFGKKKKNTGVGCWGYDSNNFITRTFVLLLNIDFVTNKLLSKFQISLPGLSLLAVCRKKHESC